MNDTDTLTTNVERGAAWLDDVRPGWYLEIDVADLDLQNSRRCVLGQLAVQIAEENGVSLDDHVTGYDAIVYGAAYTDLECILQFRRAGAPAYGSAGEWSLDHGFRAGCLSYRDLDDLWIKAIKRRVDA